MRKFFVLIFILCSFSVFSQRFEGGIFLGACGSQIDGDANAGYNKAGFIGGAFVALPLNEKWFSKVEVKYIGKGSHILDDEGQTIFKIKLHYVEMPLLAVFQYNSRFSFEAGIAESYLIKAYFEDIGGETEENELYKNFETSFLTGINFHFSTSWAANLRFQYSLFPILDVPHQYNNLISCILCYKIPQN